MKRETNGRQKLKERVQNNVNNANTNQTQRKVLAIILYHIFFLFF
uniref:Uncharacterized protein n=1 Tax=Anguilla anguilla TaxID=7936 RepID=A0A0E9RK00_ANGAN